MARFLYVLLVSVAIAAAQDYSATNYNAGDSGRHETVSPDGSVQGQYSYTDPNGKLITVKYRAGKDGFQVEGDHLPKAPAPQHPAPQAPAHHAPASANGYNPFHNPNVPAHLYQQAPTHPPQHYQPQQPAAPASTNGYNPFHNPHVPAHLYQQAPTHPPHLAEAPTHPPQHYQAHAQQPVVPTSSNGYNPFHNPHVPAHLYQQAPTHPPQHYQPQQPASNQFPAGTFSGNNNFGSFGHPNALPGSQQKSGRGPVRVSVNQQPQGFTYNFETAN